MNAIGPGIITVIAGIIGLAIVAVLVGKNAQTSSVIQGTGTALSSIINAAVSPVAGSTQGSFGGNSQGAGGTAG